MCRTDNRKKFIFFLFCEIEHVNFLCESFSTKLFIFQFFFCWELSLLHQTVGKFLNDFVSKAAGYFAILNHHFSSCFRKRKLVILCIFSYRSGQARANNESKFSWSFPSLRSENGNFLIKRSKITINKKQIFWYRGNEADWMQNEKKIVRESLIEKEMFFLFLYFHCPTTIKKSWILKETLSLRRISMKIICNF